MSILHSIGALFSGIALAIASLFTPTPMPDYATKADVQSVQVDVYHLQETVGTLRADRSVGASLTVPTVVALFETTLASAISSSATTMTLTSATDKTGTTLASSTYAFIIDENSSSEEMVLADCTGTSCANITRGINPITGTSTTASLQKAHRRGASVKITDGPQLMILSRIINGNGTVPNTLHYASTRSSLAADLTAVPDVNYVNTVAISGAPDASAVAKGIVELATGLEAASSTAFGSTAASLVLPASIATDTPNTGTRGSKVLMSLIGGYLNQGWLDLTANWTFTAASSTGFGVLGSALAVNSVNYRFPAAQGTASTTLVNNGSGTLSWGQPFEQLLDASTTPSAIAGSSIATTTLYSFNVPANTLSTGNVIRVKMYIQTLGVTNAKFVGIEAAYGNASTTMYISNGTAGILSPSGVLEFLIQANGTTASQVTEMNLVGAAGFGSTAVGGESGTTLSIDSTQAQKIVVAAAMSNSSASDKFLIRRVTTEILRY